MLIVRDNINYVLNVFMLPVGEVNLFEFLKKQKLKKKETLL